MKRFLTLTSVFALLLSGCNKKEPASIVISGSPEVKLFADGSAATVTFSVNCPWEVSVPVDWIQVNPRSGSASDEAHFKVTATRNPNPEPRTATLTITADVATKTVTVTQDASAIPVTGISVSPIELTMDEGGDPVRIVATLTPADATDKTVEWQSSNPSVATVSEGVVTAVSEGTARITASAGGLSASCLVTVEAGFKAVDLGLSVKWANMNLGAESPEQFGRYYAWGEVEYNRGNYVDETYKWGSYAHLTKYDAVTYPTVSGNNLLEEADDAAHAELSGDWRMPTSEEVFELFATRDNPKYDWEVIEVNGQALRKITCRENGNSILLPMSGYKFRTQFFSVGSEGLTWAADCVQGNPNFAYAMTAFPAGTRAGEVEEGVTAKERYMALPIRPVKGARTVPVSYMAMDAVAKALAEGEEYTLPVSFWPENATDKSVTWTSTDPEVAKVDGSGKITALKIGKTNIEARHCQRSLTCQVEVTLLGYGAYVRNEAGWGKVSMLARLPDHPNFTVESAGEKDGYLYFPLDESYMTQELYYSFRDDKGHSTGDLRKPAYSYGAIYHTLTK